ncbi:MAG: InlB B-repeat-containing protein [Lachnospiraceae bacterium]|nr:InlB B-repeat-containing protein [Lachnospiraceae bacterium]
MNKRLGKRLTAFALAVMIVSGSLFSETLISEAAGSENKYYIYTDNWSEYTNKKRCNNDINLGTDEDIFDGISNFNFEHEDYSDLPMFLGYAHYTDENGTRTYTAMYNNLLRRTKPDETKEEPWMYLDSSKFGGYRIRIYDEKTGLKPKKNFIVKIKDTDQKTIIHSFTQNDFDSLGYCKVKLNLKDKQNLNNSCGDKVNKNYPYYHPKGEVNFYRIYVSDVNDEDIKNGRMILLPYDRHAFLKYVLESKDDDFTIRTLENCCNDTAFLGYKDIKYPISYDLNGGKNNKENPSYYTSKKATTIKDPTKKGYTFTGWVLTNKYGQEATYHESVRQYTLTDNTIQKNSYGKVYLKATWKRQAGYSKISYKLNGGKNNKKNASTYKTQNGITLKNPTKKGYTFKGWYLDSKCKKNKLKSNKIPANTGNVKVYAKWKKNSYKITYQLNKGKNNKKNPAKYTVTSKNITLKAPTRKGYTFKGWYKDKKFKKKITTIKKGSIGNKTLFAKWGKTK